MITLPHRSVTRFFIPLIDVLILLFCIFLLMPFVAQQDRKPDTRVERKEERREPPEPRFEKLPDNPQQLKKELARSRNERDRLRRTLEEPVSVQVLEVDPLTGELYVKPTGGQRVLLANVEAVRRMVAEHERRSGTRKPHFLILLPQQASGKGLSVKRINQYEEWFRGRSFGFYPPLRDL